MKVAGIERPVLWFVAPHPAFLLDRINHALTIYYCIDDHAAHPGVDVERIRAFDLTLTQRADHVFVAPPTLVDAKRRINPATSFSPHGVDTELFARAQDEATEVPAPAAALAHPVIGYFGLIAPWTDVEMIEWLAQQRPQWQFLLVGHASADVTRLKGMNNVTFVGPQPYESLPGWAKAFDVAIIPYRQNQQVQNANPLKLREYLATGKPVVSVPTTEVEKFRDVLEIQADREGFLAAIERSLATDSAEKRQARTDSVREMSWEHRVEQTLETVNALLRRGTAPDPLRRV
jgi:glycosyltransferase involved in cell wall biosynthesis